MKYKDLHIGDWFTYKGLHFIKVINGGGQVYPVSLDVSTFGLTTALSPNDEVNFCSSICYNALDYPREDDAYADVRELIKFVGIFDKQNLPFSIYHSRDLKLKYKYQGVVWEVTFCGEKQGYSILANTMPENDYFFYKVFRRDFPETA